MIANVIERQFKFALLGPSGCGKTTLLRLLAGFEIPSEGTLSIDGQNMEGVDPNRRPVNMVFQSYAVFPHMKVFDNVAYGLKVTGVAKAEIRERVEEALELVQLGGFGIREPDQLSGGQRQRKDGERLWVSCIPGDTLVLGDSLLRGVNVAAQFRAACSSLCNAWSMPWGSSPMSQVVAAYTARIFSSP